MLRLQQQRSEQERTVEVDGATGRPLSSGEMTASNSAGAPYQSPEMRVVDDGEPGKDHYRLIRVYM